MPQSIGKCVLWHRNRAAALRYIEEVELLEEEFRWYILSCETMDNIWKQLGSPSTFADTTSAKYKSISAGSSAYALQRAHGYREMAKQAQVHFQSFDGTWPKEGQSLILYLWEQRPLLEVDWVEAAKQRMEEAIGLKAAKEFIKTGRADDLVQLSDMEDASDEDEDKDE
jgi:hypothetical protein